MEPRRLTLAALLSVIAGCPSSKDDSGAARPMVASPTSTEALAETGPPGSATECRSPAGKLMHEGDICDLEDLGRSESGNAQFLHCYANKCQPAADICKLECAKRERDNRKERLLQLCTPRCGR